MTYKDNASCLGFIAIVLYCIFFFKMSRLTKRKVLEAFLSKRIRVLVPTTRMVRMARAQPWRSLKAGLTPWKSERLSRR